MTENGIELTRRKILGSMGAVGAAGAVAGFGTSALFTDEESFTDNTIAAGELDLKVDWEEHYYDESQDLSDIDVQLASGGVPDGYRGFPSEDPTVAVLSEDVPDFMDATAREAFPDPNDNGIQGDQQNADFEYDACNMGADTPADLDPREGLRTQNDDTLVTNEEGNEMPAPLINLQDVKPGDFGEVTLSFHLCDNPGYVWLQGALVNAAENGTTDPESADQNEQDGVVELLDEVQTKWWYDDGNNLLDRGGTEADESDVMIVFDASGSMDNPQSKLDDAKSGAKSLVDALGSGARVGLVTFEDTGDEQVRATLDDSNSDVKNAIDNISAGGSTAIGDGIDLGQNEVLTGTGARSAADKVLVVLGNGGENEGTDPVVEADDAKSQGITIYSIAYGDGADEELMEDISSPPKDDDGNIDGDDEFAFKGGQADIGDIFTGIGETIAGGEEVFFEGTLREALDVLSDGDGFPLDANTSSEQRGCFEASSDHYIGFEWRVPLSVGNQIQSDSVSFDLGFYTEQCRNNDGSGSSSTSTPQT